MSRATLITIVLVFTGMAVFAWGARVSDPNVRWAGIAFWVAALIVRVVSRRRAGGSQ